MSAENMSLKELEEKVAVELQGLVTVSGANKEILVLNLEEGKDRRQVMEKLAQSDIVVERFGSYQPSLNDIFVEKVGENE